jgi:histidine triad (HIT) family protein
VDSINAENAELVGYLFSKIPEIAKAEGLAGGYRVISNCGPDACQSVPHLHFHIIGGRQLSDSMA